MYGGEVTVVEFGSMMMADAPWVWCVLGVVGVGGAPSPIDVVLATAPRKFVTPLSQFVHFGTHVQSSFPLTSLGDASISSSKIHLNLLG